MKNYMHFHQTFIDACRPLWALEPEQVWFEQGGQDLMRASYPAILRDDIEAETFTDGRFMHYVMWCHNGDEVLSVTFDMTEKNMPVLELTTRGGGAGVMVPHRVQSLAEFLLELADAFGRAFFLGNFERSMIEMFAKNISDTADVA